MNELFLKIINMSISASWLVLAVLFLRLLFKKAPKWVNVLLWGFVAVRLILPFSFESTLSLIPSAETISPTIMIDKTPSIQTGIPVINSVINPVIGDSFALIPEDSVNPLQIWIPILSIIWVAGAIILFLYTAISYWYLQHKVNEAFILRDNIFQSENVSTPFVLGIIRPKVYLPYKIDEQYLCHVIAHEQAHICRKDHWWKPLGFLLLTIHWFNPLMWLAYVLLCRDIELACDEKVIKELGNNQRADYTQTLVACSVNHRMIAACPLAFGEVGVKERVKSVMNYKKPAFCFVILTVITCVVVAVCFLTDPIGNGHSNEKDYYLFIGAEGVASIEMSLPDSSGGVVNADGSVFKQGEKIWLEQFQGITDLRGVTIKALDTNGKIIYEFTVPEDATTTEIINIVSSDDWLQVPNNFEDNLSKINGKTYVYERNGIAGNFSITLFDNGTFSYYEGLASSYIGIGEWERNDDIVTLTDKEMSGYSRVNHFKVNGDTLIYISENSSNFIYVQVKDGEKFHRTSTGESFGIISSTHATKWFDYLETPDEMNWDGYLESDVPEFPNVTFRWSYGKMEAVAGNEILSLYTGMPIWNAYFCDLTGDGFPELCSSLSMGSGMIDNHIIIYDYANGASYILEDRGVFDYTLRLNKSDSQLYVDKRTYFGGGLVDSGRLVFQDDRLHLLGKVSTNPSITEIDDPTKNEDFSYDAAVEMFFEDERNEYYFSGIYSQYVIVHYSDGTTEDISTALKNGKATIADLERFGIRYWAESK